MVERLRDPLGNQSSTESPSVIQVGFALWVGYCVLILFILSFPMSGLGSKVSPSFGLTLSSIAVLTLNELAPLKSLPSISKMQSFSSSLCQITITSSPVAEFTVIAPKGFPFSGSIRCPTENKSNKWSYLFSVTSYSRRAVTSSSDIKKPVSLTDLTSLNSKDTGFIQKQVAPAMTAKKIIKLRMIFSYIFKPNVE